MPEEVLVIPTALFRERGGKDGLVRDPQLVTELLTTLGATRYMDRAQAEQDPTFKQIIPYVLFRYQHIEADGTSCWRYYSYQRTKLQGETRLHGKRSLGVGGHINPCDDGPDSYNAALLRELREEVVLPPNVTLRAPIAYINDESNDVGKVHLGVIHIADMGVYRPGLKPAAAFPVAATKAPELESAEPDNVVSCLFTGRDALVEGIVPPLDSFENWSQIIIRELLPQLD